MSINLRIIFSIANSMFLRYTFSLLIISCNIICIMLCICDTGECVNKNKYYCVHIYILRAVICQASCSKDFSVGLADEIKCVMD